MLVARKFAITPTRVVLCLALVTAGVGVVGLVALRQARRVSTLDDFATHGSVERYALAVKAPTEPHLASLQQILDKVATIVDMLVAAERSAVADRLDDRLRRNPLRPSPDDLKEFGRQVALGLAIDDLEEALRGVYAAGIRCYVANRRSGTADELLAEHGRLTLAIATWRRQAGSAAAVGEAETALFEVTEQLALWMKSECGVVLGEAIETTPAWPRSAALVRMGEAAWRRELARRNR